MVIHKCQKLVQIIDVAVPMDNSNVSAKEIEKIDKYKDLSLEVENEMYSYSAGYW